MAHSDRDGAANSRRPSSFSTGSSITGRNDKPLFTARDRKGKYFTGTGATKDESEDVEPSAAVAGRTEGRNWLGRPRSNNKLGLGEAFRRLDENGTLKPKVAQSTGVRDSPRPESRIPRRASYTPDGTPSPPRSLGKAYRMAEAEERAASVPIENQRLRQDTSPSPAARPRTLSRGSADETRMQRLRNSDALDLKGKRGSPLRRQNKPAESMDDTSILASSDSSISGLSLVEDPTEDDFDQKMRKFSIDQQRISEMARSQRGPFSRADIGPRVAETARSLVKKTSASSFVDENEPPIQPPRTWGSKAKKLQGWISKAMSPESSVEIKGFEPAINSGQEPTERQGVDIPLPSIEEASIQQEPTPPSSRPASAQPHNMSPEKSKLWAAELDFTAQSITMSPQLRVRNTKIDDIRSREIQTLAKSAIASGRLEEIRERNSEERSKSPEVVRKASREMVSQSPAPSRESDKEESVMHERTILDEEGEPIRGTPITIFSSSSYVARSNSNSSEQRSDHDREGSRSAHNRDDSRDVLRRLSRATSGSPSPFRTEEKVKGRTEKNGETVEEAVDDKTRKALQEREFSKLIERPSDVSVKRLSQGLELESKRLSASDVDPEERIAAEASLFELPDNKSERNSIRVPSPAPSNNGNIDTIPVASRPEPLSLPTPKVTGAYIDTPMSTVRQPRRLREVPSSAHRNNVVEGDETELAIKNIIKDTSNPSRERSLSLSRATKDRSSSKHPQQQATQPKERPPLVNTANPSTASEDLRRIQQEAQIDDSTLDDFDAILEADAESTGDLNATTLSRHVVDLEYDSRGRPLSLKDKEMMLERLALERMSKSLKKTSASIRDAKRGIEGLIEGQESSSRAQEPHNHAICPTCLAQSSNHHITIPIPRLTTRTPPNHHRRLTWFGLFLTIFTAWYISESVMCEFFCHPKYASTNDISWSPWDPFFPFAIPSKLDHWSGRVVSGTAFKVYNVWTDGKAPRPRWAGPDPRGRRRQQMMKEYPAATQGKETKLSASSRWSWLGFGGGDEKQKQKEKDSMTRGNGAWDEDENGMPQGRELEVGAGWHWPGFGGQEKRRAKFPDPPPWDDASDEESMFEDETI